MTNVGSTEKGRGLALRLFAIVGALVLTGMIEDQTPTIFLIGDSTMADKPLIGNPERGWGMAFPLFVSDGKATVENHARNGRSTKSFLREGRWDAVCARIRPGDYVLIQFGHNDQKLADTNRYAAPRTEYRENLIRFVRETREKGGSPVLLTPVARRKFKRGAVVDTHLEYSQVVREVAAAERVPLIDADSLSRGMLAEVGEEKSKDLYLWLRPGLLSRADTGKGDNTHFNSRGALAVARIVAHEVRKQGLPLAQLLIEGEPPSRIEPEKTVLLDNFFNNEWRPDKAGVPTRFHYVWQDTTNSGFSILAKRIADLGACIDTLCGPPLPEALARASVYVIVDPDTPAETAVPNYISPDEAETIRRWVEGGGVLLMLGNDRGNAEFEHWNELAAKFGIRFIEETVNRVEKNAYGTGTFERFPDHPLFRGVRKIFLKEISTLEVRDPAAALLLDGGRVIMASARCGKGLVFAVGDPWLYDEYMDARRLPADYDNALAGENLFRWLLGESRPVVWR